MAISAVMSEELTITQATQRLTTRGIDVSRRTVASWVEQGLFKSKRWVDIPTGGYWVVSASELDSFEKPTAGRPPKPKEEGKASKKK